MSVYGAILSAAWILLFASACGQPADDLVPAGPTPSGTASGGNTPAISSLKSAPRPKLPVLGAGERRVTVFVVPGDALVEVDDQPTRRRDGVIELIGNVGEVRRLRAFKGARSTEEKLVTIGEDEASPSRIDLNEAPAPGAPGSTAGKPFRYDNYDE